LTGVTPSCAHVSTGLVTEALPGHPQLALQQSQYRVVTPAWPLFPSDIVVELLVLPPDDDDDELVLAETVLLELDDDDEGGKHCE